MLQPEASIPNNQGAINPPFLCPFPFVLLFPLSAPSTSLFLPPLSPSSCEAVLLKLAAMLVWGSAVSYACIGGLMVAIDLDAFWQGKTHVT